MYATLGKSCPYAPVNRQFPYCNQHELEIGYRSMITDSTKVKIPKDVYNPPPPKALKPAPVRNPVEDNDVC